MASSTEWDLMVGLAIATRRRKQQQTQEVLAHAAGVHRNYLADVERGRKSPTMRVFYAVATALQTTPDRLARQAMAYLNDPEKREAAVAALPPRLPGRPAKVATSD